MDDVGEGEGGRVHRATEGGQEERLSAAQKVPATG